MDREYGFPPTSNGRYTVNMKTVGIYLGTATDPVGNVEKVLRSWGEFLSEYELHVFGSASVPASIQDAYYCVKTRERTSRTPYGKILSSYRDGIEYVNAESPDVLVQLWKYSTHAPGIAAAAWRSDVPVVTRFTGDVFSEFRGFTGPKRLGVLGLNNVFGRMPIHLSDAMITLGPNGRSELVKRGLDSERAVIIPPPLDIDGRFSPPETREHLRESLGISPDRTVLLYVGRLTEQKGMSFLMDVVDQTRARSDLLYLLVGEGPYRHQFETRYDDDYVRTVGRVPYEDIDRYYKAANCYVHPSRFEGLPLVLLEALSCGLPVIARRAGDVEFVTENVVESPTVMAEQILAEGWDGAWRNRACFTASYQRRQLRGVLESVTQ
jgi:glycosyltransferase involved in cell wall biosynthesis